MKILVIEDDTDIREALVFLLESEGYEVAAAENGKAALDLLSQGRNPELILVDLFMPVMDGLTFRKKQLGRPEIAKIPVILMSADGGMDEKKEHAQALHYFAKPLNVNALLSAIQVESERLSLAY